MGKIPANEGRLEKCKLRSKHLEGFIHVPNQSLTFKDSRVASPLPHIKEELDNQKIGTVLPLFLIGEVIMVWGLIRVVLFTAAFLAGLMVGGPGPRSMSASSDVTACSEGRVIVIPLKGGSDGIIQLNCVGGKLMIARNRSDGMEIIPKKSLICNQLWTLL